MWWGATVVLVGACYGFAEVETSTESTNKQCGDREVWCTLAYETSLESCLLEEKRCNGYFDCALGEDEDGCPPAKLACRLDQLRCRNGECVHLSQRCDFKDDCGDNSDEEQCNFPSCAPGEFQCGNRRCVPAGFRCDGYTDCSDGADERGCSADACASGLGGNCTAGNCEGGRAWSAEAGACVDVDECARWGSCHQLCANTLGSYECSCATGYTKSNERCWSFGDTAILVAHDQGGLRVEFTTAGTIAYRDLMVNRSTDAVDFHFRKDWIVWAGASQNSIHLQKLRASGDGKNIFIKTLLFGLPWQPVALAVDWITDNLYLVDALNLRIDVIDLGKNIIGTVLGAHLKNPQDLALDPTAGLMFVADDDQILRADMDGTNVKIILKQNISEEILSVSVDIITRRVFYCYSESRYNYIETVDYGGQHKYIVLRRPNGPRPRKISIFQDKVYWIAPYEKVIGEISKYKGAASEKVLFRMEEMGEPKGLMIFNKLKQPHVQSPCDGRACSQLCVLKRLESGNLTHRCDCRIGYVLHNETACVRVETFLVYSRGTHVKGEDLDYVTDDFTEAIHPVASKEGTFVGIDFDAHTEHIYYSDIKQNIIYRMNRSGIMNEAFFNMTSGYAEMIAMDWISKNLYFTNPINGTLGVISTKNKHKKLLLENLKSPRAIVVHPNKGYVFFSEWKTPGNIYRLNTDGTDLTGFNDAEELGWPNGLSIDFDLNRLYWCDAKFHRVQHSNFDGLDTKTINSDLIGHPFSIAIYKDFMYVSDWRLKGIIRFDKLSSGTIGEVVEQAPTKAYFGLKIYDKDLQKIDPSQPCLDNNGGCEKFCFAIPNNNDKQLTVSCGCPDDERLSPDGRSCVKSTSNTRR